MKFDKEYINKNKLALIGIALTVLFGIPSIISLLPIIEGLINGPQARLSIFYDLTEKGSNQFVALPEELDSINIICCLESDTIDREKKVTLNFITLPFEISVGENEKPVHVTYSIIPINDEQSKPYFVLDGNHVIEGTFLDSINNGRTKTLPLLEDNQALIKPSIPTLSQKRMTVLNNGLTAKDTINEYIFKCYVSQQEGNYDPLNYIIKCTFITLDSEVANKGDKFFLFYANSLIGPNVNNKSILYRYEITSREPLDSAYNQPYCIYQDCVESYGSSIRESKIEFFYHKSFFLIIFLLLVFGYILFNCIKRSFRYDNLLSTNKELKSSHRKRIIKILFKKESFPIVMLLLLIWIIRILATNLFHLYFFIIPD